MAQVLTMAEIAPLLNNINLVDAMEKAFVEYSGGDSVVPPIGELVFDKPKGDTHIKYGYLKGHEYFVIKIASGFYENVNLGISTSQGLMLIFSQQTGQTKAVLLDDGKLTDLRTAAAGALVARYYAPSIRKIGIIGTGIQAKLQLQYLLKDSMPESVWVWGRTKSLAEKFKIDSSSIINVNVAETPAELAANSNLIITTTPAEKPILLANDILPGTHITAVGSDTSTKQELDPAILNKADLVISDSIEQSHSRGEIYQAALQGFDRSKVIELGAAIQSNKGIRTNDEEITVVDLTGVAVQDIMIATEIFKYHLAKN